MSIVKIRCIKKDGGNHENPHEGVTHYGWVDSSGDSNVAGREAMVEWVEKSGNEAYVESLGGDKAYCDVRTGRSGRKFLQTYADGNYNNNLLNLPECVT